MTNYLAAALDVKSVDKSTICGWFLFWLCVALAIAFANVAFFVYFLVSGRASLAWGMVPSLLLTTIAVASNYFIYAMCSKLPEGFRSY